MTDLTDTSGLRTEPNSTSDRGLVSQVRRIARRFVILTVVVIGVICGVLAVLFHRYVELMHDLLIGRALLQHGIIGRVLVVAVPATVFAALSAIVQRVAPRAVGANLARVRMAYNRDPSVLSARSIIATFLATPVSLGAGAPLGPEGPIVVVTSGVSAGLARMLHLPKKLVRGMIPVGVAAGIAAVFNTPITGVVFALEEVFGTAERGLLGGVIVGAVAAAVVERSMLGGQPLLAAPSTSWSDPRELLGFALAGVLAGAFSGYSIAAMHWLKRCWARAMPSMVLRTATAGALIGLLGLIAPSILGVGYHSVSFWLHGGGSAAGSGIAFGVKVLAFVVAVSSGVLGGTFAPSLFMGAALGSAIGHGALALFPASGIDPKAYALVGMGAFFAGLLRSPIAAVLIVVELTRDYDLILPLMLAVSLSIAVSRRISHLSIVERQMADEGYEEIHYAGDPLAALRVMDAMSRDPQTIAPGATLVEGAALAATTRHRIFPVCDREGRLLGIVRRESLLTGATGIAAGVMEASSLTVFPEDELIDVVARMQHAGVDRCPVVVDTISQRLIGFLSPSDILRARMSNPGEEQQTFEIFE